MADEQDLLDGTRHHEVKIRVAIAFAWLALALPVRAFVFDAQTKAILDLYYASRTSYTNTTADLAAEILARIAGDVAGTNFGSYVAVCATNYTDFRVAEALQGSTPGVLAYIANTMWVATYGDDANDGLTPETAKLTIPAALSAVAGLNWTVVVRDGTYSVPSQLVVQNYVTLKSENGADACILQGTGADRVVYIKRGVVDGFTITGGHEANDSGGGVRMDSASVLRNCKVHGNSAAITDYWLAGNGGGVMVWLWDALIEDCEIYDNTAEGYGGGIYIYVGGGYQAVRSCLIRDNQAEYGGGISAEIFGTSRNECSIESCTVVANTALSAAGGLHFQTYYSVTMRGNVKNTISYGNIAPIDGEFQASGAGLVVYTTYSCIAPLLSGEGNIAVDPLFDGGGYYLTDVSPCRDTGSQAGYDPAALDLDGHPRVVGTEIDMGCYEFRPEATESLNAFYATMGRLELEAPPVTTEEDPVFAAWLATPVPLTGIWRFDPPGIFTAPAPYFTFAAGCWNVNLAGEITAAAADRPDALWTTNAAGHYVLRTP